MVLCRGKTKRKETKRYETKKKKTLITCLKINNSSSTGEAIMICIDTSRWIKSTESPMFEDQANAIKLYYTEKLKSHPETFEGICGMGDRCITHLCKPTRELSEIIGSLYAARIGGYLLLLDAVTEAHGVWFSLSGKKLGGHLPKRIVVFAGG
ncbi:dehydroascorbate reductase 2, partial [Tanacetum coccineum]